MGLINGNERKRLLCNVDQDHPAANCTVSIFAKIKDGIYGPQVAAEAVVIRAYLSYQDQYLADKVKSTFSRGFVEWKGTYVPPLNSTMTITVDNNPGLAVSTEYNATMLVIRGAGSPLQTIRYHLDSAAYARFNT